MQKNTRPIVFLFLIAVLAALAIPAVSATYQNYTAAGTYYWVAPDGESYINLILTGGGAAGTKGNPVAGGGNGGYGGGAGSTNTQNSIPVTSGVNYTIVVGDGGLSGTISSPGSNSSAFSYTATGGSVNGGSAYSGVNGGAGAAGYTEDGVGGSAGSGTAAYGSGGIGGSGYGSGGGGGSGGGNTAGWGQGGLGNKGFVSIEYTVSSPTPTPTPTPTSTPTSTPTLFQYIPTELDCDNGSRIYTPRDIWSYFNETFDLKPNIYGFHLGWEITPDHTENWISHFYRESSESDFGCPVTVYEGDATTPDLYNGYYSAIEKVWCGSETTCGNYFGFNCGNIPGYNDYFVYELKASVDFDGGGCGGTTCVYYYPVTITDASTGYTITNSNLSASEIIDGAETHHYNATSATGKFNLTGYGPIMLIPIAVGDVIGLFGTADGYQENGWSIIASSTNNGITQIIPLPPNSIIPKPGEFSSVIMAYDGDTSMGISGAKITVSNANHSQSKYTLTGGVATFKNMTATATYTATASASGYTTTSKTFTGSSGEIKYIDIPMSASGVNPPPTVTVTVTGTGKYGEEASDQDLSSWIRSHAISILDFLYLFIILALIGILLRIFKIV